MEEKKLTDEEIVKALEVCSKEKHCGICAVRHFCEEIKLGALNLIHRLQDEKQKVVQDYYCEAQHCDVQKDIIAKQKAEIERLTREVDKQKNFVTAWEESWKIANEKNTKIRVKLKKENAELQKQVDELKEKLWKSKQDMMTYHSKTVAEVAKGTAKEILQMFDDRNYITENELKKAIAKRYGVGVE